jgi:hypothetical protein
VVGVVRRRVGAFGGSDMGDAQNADAAGAHGGTVVLKLNCSRNVVAWLVAGVDCWTGSDKGLAGLVWYCI